MAGAEGDAERDQRAAFEAAAEQIRSMQDALAAYRAAGDLIDLQTEFRDAGARLRLEQIRRIWIAPDGPKSYSKLGEVLGVSKARAAELIRAATPSPEEDPTLPERQPVAAAIVTSPLGLLVARRNDGMPLWTFISGEVEPGEAPKDTVVREVKEETTLEVAAGRILGRRVHPKTGRTMIYLACRPVKGADPASVVVGDSEELAEVRWVGLEEAGHLLPGMFEPVHAYLERQLRGGTR